MTRVLVTGATGVLGRALLERLDHQEFAVRAAARHVPASGSDSDVEWVSIDVASGDGVQAALDGVDVVLHAVNAGGRGSREVNVDGLQGLLLAARTAGVSHVIYPSIVGIDRIPLAYYRQKLEAEKLVARGAVGWTLVRGTQFHDLIDHIFSRLSRFPVVPLPRRVPIQPIDVGDYASVLIDCVRHGPAGKTDNVAGPEILPLGTAFSRWLSARGRSKLVLPAVIPGRLGRELRSGALTDPEAGRGRVTWNNWLLQQRRQATQS